LTPTPKVETTEVTMTTLATVRRDKGISQVELALRSGIQPGLICRYERGLRPSQRNARRVADALECLPEVIFPDYQTLRDY
jgi:transcriptional regulator with XRE-family HTH domain